MKEQWVLFSLAGQHYCTDARQIREIIAYRPPNPVPGSPADVEGIISVRQDKITLFSGTRLVAQQAQPPQEDGHIVLLDGDGSTFGMTVDGVDGIVELDPKDIDPSSMSRDKTVLGTAMHRGRLITAVSLLTFCENALAEQE